MMAMHGRVKKLTLVVSKSPKPSLSWRWRLDLAGMERASPDSPDAI